MNEVTVTAPLSWVAWHAPDFIKEQARRQLPDPGYVPGKSVQHIMDLDGLFLGWGRRTVCNEPVLMAEVDAFSEEPIDGFRLCKRCEQMSPHGNE